MSGNLIFDRAAQRRVRQRISSGFSDHAFLHNRVAEDIVDRLSVTLRSFETCVVLGSADGHVARSLSALDSIDNVVTTDIADAFADQNLGAHVICDEEFVPFANESLDLIVAPLCLQQVNDLPGCLVQLRRCLKPDGLLLATTLGGQTLSELRTSLMLAEEEICGGVSPRVAPFADVRELGGLLQRAGFALPVTDSDVVSVRYGALETLMRDLRGMGLGNQLIGRRRQFTPRRLFQRAAEIYAERFADNGKLTATFELVTLTGWAPHDSQQKPLAPGSAKMRLADALDTTELSTGVKAGKPETT